MTPKQTATKLLIMFDYCIDSCIDYCNNKIKAGITPDFYEDVIKMLKKETIWKN